MSQSRQCNRHFFFVAAAHAICDDVYFVSGSQEVKRGLRDADVAFDTDDDAGERAGGVEGIERLLDLWCSEGERRVSSSILPNRSVLEKLKHASWKTRFCRHGRQS